MNHQQFMRIALAEGRAALDAGDFPVGCVLVEDDRVLVRGRRTNSSGADFNELDHAEVAALRRLLTMNPQTDCSRITAYSTMEPCLMCYATMLLSGIRRFVWAFEDIMGGGTNVPLKQLHDLYADMQVELVPDVLRAEALSLFQNFFRQHEYWRDSPLARYTLAQPFGEIND
ncbi:MAG: nucleoside deaminase [Deltaproteobacteria bacterium]|nr:nucleoside deaminase [Deltaproteobacteria bacterium]